MDNAANNDTFAVALAEGLRKRKISGSFSARERRIRLVLFLVCYPANFSYPYRCFPHIVNLACKAIVGRAAGMDPDLDSIKTLQGVIQHVSILLVDFVSIFVSILSTCGLGLSMDLCRWIMPLNLELSLVSQLCGIPGPYDLGTCSHWHPVSRMWHSHKPELPTSSMAL
jgi:hypothetical protein